MTEGGEVTHEDALADMPELDEAEALDAARLALAGALARRSWMDIPSIVFLDGDMAVEFQAPYHRLVMSRLLVMDRFSLADLTIVSERLLSEAAWLKRDMAAKRSDGSTLPFRVPLEFRKRRLLYTVIGNLIAQACVHKLVAARELHALLPADLSQLALRCVY